MPIALEGRPRLSALACMAKEIEKRAGFRSHPGFRSQEHQSDRGSTLCDLLR